jgi:hypothetical protein
MGRSVVQVAPECFSHSTFLLGVHRISDEPSNMEPDIDEVRNFG